MGRLSIYSAAAGSGKTHKIVGKFISMLFLNEHAYKHILAVTFTNKAGEEMKTRIIHELYNIAYNKESNYISEIQKEYKINEPEIRNKAKRIFKSIIHDYSNLSISTIDSFFQKILKNFAYESGIQYNYEIELDANNVINDVVDNLIIKANDDTRLKSSLIKLINQNILEGKKWNTKYSLKNFISSVYTSDFKQFENEYNDFFSDNEKTKQFLKSLEGIIKAFENKVQNFSNEFKLFLNDNDLSISDFKGGKTRSIPKKMIELEKQLEKNEVDDVFKNILETDEWLKKDSLDDSRLVNTVNTLMQKCKDIYAFLQEHIKTYNTAKLVKKQFYFMSLIGYALSEINTYKRENNKFMINEVPEFLSEISQKNSSSFIYEKTGSFYKNYLIDEFQDTSEIQWQAFKPLIEESLAHISKNENILVGDVKQSIYGWRGGDWKLLGGKVESEFKNICELTSLDDNWRSDKKIVDFNNKYFEKAAISIGDFFNNNYQSENQQKNIVKDNIYSNIKQNCKSNKEGYVEINLIEHSKKAKENEIKALNLMIEQIELIQEKGYSAGDIMILVRKNDEGSKISSHILDYSLSDKAKKDINYDVISAESLFINTNEAIIFIISCLKLLLDPDNKLAYTEAAFMLYRFNYHTNNSENTHKEFDIKKHYEYFDDKFKQIDKALLSIPLPEICDRIVKHFELNKNKKNIAFITSFKDIVHEFSQSKSSDIYSFLEWWEEFGEKQSLKMPEKQNAINIITMHKAKGLAANFVLIPFCNWDLVNHSGIIYCNIPQEPFNILSVWPLNFNKILKNSLASKNYTDKIFNSIVESFNLMYVAFTRAKKAMFINAVDNDSKEDYKNVGQILASQIDSLMQDKELNIRKTNKQETGINKYQMGNIENTQKSEYNNTYLNEYPVYIPDKQPVIKSFLRDIDDLPDNKSLLKKGLLYHSLFEKIKYIDDIDYAVKDKLSKGEIREKDYDIISNSLNKILNGAKVKQWFDGTYDVLNEKDIFTGNGELKRPDRIMIKDDKAIVVDYKFGANKNKYHIKQIKEYGNLLKNMNYKHVEMYIWYVFLEEIISV